MTLQLKELQMQAVTSYNSDYNAIKTAYLLDTYPELKPDVLKAMSDNKITLKEESALMNKNYSLGKIAEFKETTMFFCGLL